MVYYASPVQKKSRLPFPGLLLILLITCFSVACGSGIKARKIMDNVLVLTSHNTNMAAVKIGTEVVVIDTPPLGLVSDTLELIKYSFIPLLIVRQDITYKKSLDAVTEMYHGGKYKNLGIIMNDVHYRRYDYGAYYGRSYGYGSGFGYGYYDDDHKRGFWKRLFRS